MNDMSRAELGTREVQKRMDASPTARNINRAADATALGRLKNLVPERARDVLRFSAQKAALTASGLYLILSSGCGNTENPIVPSPVNEPTHSSASAVPAPTDDGVRVTITRAATPTSEQDTEGVTVKIIKAPTPVLEPTPSPTLSPTVDSTKVPTPTTEASISLQSSIQETPTPTKTQEATDYLESEIIDNVETYGDKNPLTQAQLTKLYEKLNSVVEREMRDNTYYGSISVGKATYESFRNIMDGGESVQAFIKRHEAVFNQMVHEQPYPDTNKLSIRRLIVLDDGVEIPHFSLNEFIKDSDGGWNLGSKYVPTEADYYDKNLRIDYGLLHELGHAVFHLPDQYSLDFIKHNDTDTNPLLVNMPSKWTKYGAYDRIDIGKNLMGAQLQRKEDRRIGLHSNLQLLRRAPSNEVHINKRYVTEALWKFPYELPQTVTFSFGKEYENATVQVFRTVSAVVPTDKQKKALELVETYVNPVDGELTLSKEKLFQPPQNEYNLIESENATLFIVITGLDGELSFRWMDIRDFNIPYWQGHRDHVTMNFSLASEKDDPNTFDWTIKYSP